MILLKDIKVKDYTGSEVDLETLIERLKYRQDKRRKFEGGVDRELNLEVCWQGHMKAVSNRDRCIDCGEGIRHRIIEGVLQNYQNIVRDAQGKVTRVGVKRDFRGKVLRDSQGRTLRS